MKYTKPPLTYEEQADLLLSRGMTGDHDLMVARLAAVNYYRLSGYWYPFRNLPGDDFRDGTTFEAVWSRYAFDRRLRCLVMDAIERVEVACRASLAYHHAHADDDPFAYATDPTALPRLHAADRAKFLDSLAEQIKSSKEPFAEHFRTKYGADHQHMPIWMASEIMTFGNMLALYRGSPDAIRRAVAKPLGVDESVVFSWLLTLNTIRNICAHHSRLWNRGLGVKPKIPHEKHHPDWHDPVEIKNNRLFAVLTILQYCLRRICPQSGWRKRLLDLLHEFDAVPTKSMGIPDDWADCPIWS